MHKARRHHRRGLITNNLLDVVADGVFCAADGAFDFALCLIERSFGLKLRIASDFTSRLLDGAFRLIGSAADAIFIHENSFRGEIRKLDGERSVPFAAIGAKAPRDAGMRRCSNYRASVAFQCGTVSVWASEMRFIWLVMLFSFGLLVNRSFAEQPAEPQNGSTKAAIASNFQPPNESDGCSAAAKV